MARPRCVKNRPVYPGISPQHLRDILRELLQQVVCLFDSGWFLAYLRQVKSQDSPGLVKQILKRFSNEYRHSRCRSGQANALNLPKVLHPLAGKALVSHVIDTARSLLRRAGFVWFYGHGGDAVRCGA